MGAIIAIAGCIGGKKDVTPVVKAMPDVQQFLKEHPNAEIKAALWKEDTVSSNLGEIRTTCGNQMQIKDYWKVDVNEGDISIKIWLDGKTMEPLCVIKEGKNIFSNKTSTNVTLTSNASSNQPNTDVNTSIVSNCTSQTLAIDGVSYYDSIHLLELDISNSDTYDIILNKIRIIYSDDLNTEAKIGIIKIRPGQNVVTVRESTTNGSLRSDIRKIRIVTDCPNNNIEYLGSSIKTYSTASAQSSCIPNWWTDSWGTCQSNNQQYRSVIDVNYCGTTNGMPATNQSCAS